MRSKPAPLSSAARAFATSRPSAGIRSVWSRMPRSAPMASVVRIVSWAAAGPSAITTTSPAPAFSFRRSASSTANSSYGLRMNLTPASSSDLPSAAILTRVSESGTRLMQTAIFMGAENKPGGGDRATDGARPGSSQSPVVAGASRAESPPHDELEGSRVEGREEPLQPAGRAVLVEGAEDGSLRVEEVGGNPRDLPLPDVVPDAGVGDKVGV